MPERCLGGRVLLFVIAGGRHDTQAVLNVYETFHRADGHVLKLHMDQGEGQRWNRSPGNLYSKPQRLQIGPDTIVPIALTETIMPIAPSKDTKYVRHVLIESKLLTKFWGRPMHLRAAVLVPEGFDDHPEQRYPVVFLQGHFGEDSSVTLRETPPSVEMKGTERRVAVGAYHRYQDWTSGRLPRMLLVITQHATPYYDDSYGVNTANMGPYGDALTEELYPYVEGQFHAIGKPWARVVFRRTICPSSRSTCKQWRRRAQTQRVGASNAKKWKQSPVFRAPEAGGVHVMWHRGVYDDK